MDVRTALGVEYKRREAEEAAEAALRSATEDEVAAAAASAEAGTELPTAKERFISLGKRIIALADEHKTIKGADDMVYGEQYRSETELGTEGLGISAEARESSTNGILSGWGSQERELTHLDIKWLSTAYVADTPFARQELGLEEVEGEDVAPEVYGMLRLMEQSVSAVELVRRGPRVALVE